MEKENTRSRRHHENRDDLVGEHTFGDMGQLILLVIFLVVWVADSFFLHYTTFLSPTRAGGTLRPHFGQRLQRVAWVIVLSSQPAQSR